MDLPDFIKESVSQIQILCTFQAEFSGRDLESRVVADGFTGTFMEPDFLAESEQFAGILRQV